MGKRKHVEDRSKLDASQMSSEASLQHVKRARTNSRESDVDEDGWQTVVRRGRKHEKRFKQIDAHRKHPRVYFHHANDARPPIRLEELRNLVLYVLSDGTGPSWIGVDGRKDIKKVVAIMIPGMDYAMLDRVRELIERENDTKDTDRPRDSPSNAVSKLFQAEGVNNNHNQSSDTVENQSQKTIGKADANWLLEKLFPVQAPGDTRQLRVHSPLQAMIMKGHEPTSGRNNYNTPERTFKAVRTPITDFVHTSDELQEAEYPIHPALFISQSQGPREVTRRQGAKQASSDGWIDSDVGQPQLTLPSTTAVTTVDPISRGLDIYAIDCEMVLTTDEKSSLARISVVSWPDGKVVLDKFVKPELPITNYFTQYSGITEQILKDVTTTLSDIQGELEKILTSSTVILGHSLESDLNAMKLTHPFIVDTSMIYPHPRGLPLRSSLKFLANKYLKREIQKGGVDGHDSVEDARAVLDLVKLKCEKGYLWGTNEANGETVFKKLSQTKVTNLDRDGTPRTSAIVEYGTPERGFGKDATFAIGCQNDEEVVKGILRSVHGDEDGGEISKPGVDFVWARLRALEFARGWVTNNAQSVSNKVVSEPAGSNDTTSPKPQANPNPPPPAPISPTAETDAALLETLYRLNKVRQSLPPKTLLILCSGTSDMRTVTHYQSLQAQYRREFKVKKWDQLTIRWTDVEEQELRKAVEKARLGWGWVGVL